jgi:DNA polymerase-3 subunit gamma/tau
VKFVFATTAGNKVLTTIISRCQRFDLRRISTADIVKRLKFICSKEEVNAEEDALLAIARGAEGGMRDALSSLDQLISFKGKDIKEEDALGVFGLVSRSAMETLAGALISGDVATILRSVETFDSAGKNMRRLVGELLLYFRNMAVLQALGGKAGSIEATADQIAVMEKQSKTLEPGRVFKICDLLAEAEDKLRHVLSIRTLVEISLIKASRIATTATIDELMRAVRALKENKSFTLPSSSSLQAQGGLRNEVASPKEDTASVAPPVMQAVEKKVPPANAAGGEIDDARREAIMNDEKLNSVFDAMPGASVINIRKGGAR